MKRYERRQKQRELKERQKKRGQYYPSSFTLPNRTSNLKTVEEEKEADQNNAEATLDVYRQLLPGLLKKLSRIPDPRNPNKIKHKMDVMMFYGILMYIFHIPSRRSTNRDMTTPQLFENLRAVFPELEEMPHQDTLCRLLEAMDVEKIETAYIELLKQVISKKKFRKLLQEKRYLVAVDGTQKYVMDECWDERYLRRRIKGEDGEYYYYAFVLEAVLVFANGMVIPLLSEFLENSPELEAIEDEEKWKQDCELKAFYRLSKRLKETFPKLPLTLLLDGLYANGPVIEICRKNKWKFIIVLKDGSLPSLWQEVKGLMRLDTRGEHRCERKWKGRHQVFKWVNEIEYTYDSDKKKTYINVVICDETWKGVDKKGNIENKKARHAWISSEPITRGNVHKLCNLMGRKRWLHENNILKEKRQGYQYEHIFSYDFDAMKGYHYLMHIARMLNEMAIHSVYLQDTVKEMGIQAFIRNFREVMTHRELDITRLRRLSESPGQLRLVTEQIWETSWPAA